MSINWSLKKTKEQREAEKNDQLSEISRRESIESWKKTSELKGVTLEQAYRYIDNQLDSASTAAESKEAIRRILKKMVPFILE